MSLVPKITVREEGKAIVVKNTTGLYSPNDNPTGYGVQNVIPQWIEEASLEVTALTSNKRALIDVSGVLVSDDDQYQVLPWDLGMKKFTSERYRVKFMVSGTKPDGTKFSYYTIRDVVCMHDVTCCVDKEKAKVFNAPLDNVFRSDKVKTLVEWSVILEMAHWAIRCGDLDSAEKSVLFVAAQCTCNDCH